MKKKIKLKQYFALLARSLKEVGTCTSAQWVRNCKADCKKVVKQILMNFLWFTKNPTVTYSLLCFQTLH